MRYVTRMPAEFALLYVMDIRRGGYDIRKDEHVGKWIGEHSKLFETGWAHEGAHFDGNHKRQGRL